MTYTTEAGDHSGPVHIFVAGLGNAPMPNTRHSIGQHVVTALASHFQIPLSPTKGGHMGSSTVTLPNAEGPVTITLFKSKQLMNVSGPSIVTAYRSSRSASGGAGGRVPGKDFVVLGDSISHAPMKLSARFGGSAQGHNGLKSISAALRGDKGFWQFRVGVGRGRSEDRRPTLDKSVDAAQWVLAKMSQEERDFWGVGGKGLDIVIAELGRVATQLEAT
ncbi:peptidyl-tRNA hydrolase [Coprinopsis sp. MPI-PUGE-AT-0042]|nr:peptidyl-tRNA hydrolase [Coprinopsis sp. MPI-PUGE-AT-0042]